MAGMGWSSVSYPASAKARTTSSRARRPPAVPASRPAHASEHSASTSSLMPFIVSLDKGGKARPDIACQSTQVMIGPHAAASGGILAHAGRAMKPRRAAASRTLSTRPPLRRLFWAIARLRQGKPLKAPDLAHEFEVHVRTAYRDLDFLRDEWRVPVEYDAHEGSYVLTAPMTELPHVGLSHGEVLAVYFAEKVVRQYGGTPFEEDLASAFRKILELLPEQVKVSPS